MGSILAKHSSSSVSDKQKLMVVAGITAVTLLTSYFFYKKMSTPAIVAHINIECKLIIFYSLRCISLEESEQGELAHSLSDVYSEASIDYWQV